MTFIYEQQVLEPKILPSVKEFFASLLSNSYFSLPISKKKQIFTELINSNNFNFPQTSDIATAFEIFESKFSREKDMATLINSLSSGQNQDYKKLPKLISDALLKYIQQLGNKLENEKSIQIINSSAKSFEEKQREIEMIRNNQAVLVRGSGGDYDNVLTISDIERLKISNRSYETYQVYNPFSKLNDPLELNVLQLQNHLRQKIVFSYLSVLENSSYQISNVSSSEENPDRFYFEYINPKGESGSFTLTTPNSANSGVRIQVSSPNKNIVNNNFIINPSEIIAALGLKEGENYIPGKITAPQPKHLFVPIPDSLTHDVYGKSPRVFETINPSLKKPQSINISAAPSPNNIAVTPAGARDKTSDEASISKQREEEQLKRREILSSRAKADQLAKIRQQNEEKNKREKTATAAPSASSNNLDITKFIGGSFGLFGNSFDPTGFLAAINPFNIF